MKFIIKTVLFMVALGLAANVQVSATETTPKEILEASDRARGNGPGIKWKIKIVSVENGRTQERTIGLKAKGENSLASFLAPAKVKGRMMLQKDRNMWFIKPGLRKPVPISPRQKLMGGASNADIASTNYAGDYQIDNQAEDVVNGEPCYLLDLVAINKKVTYDRIKYWISKKRHVGVKAEFFTKSGKMFKSATFEYNNEIVFDEEKTPFVSKMTITDAVIKENITTLLFSDVAVKRLPSSTFNLNLLVR
jgi:hypothetical protein